MLMVCRSFSHIFDRVSRTILTLLILGCVLDTSADSWSPLNSLTITEGDVVKMQDGGSLWIALNDAKLSSMIKSNNDLVWMATVDPKQHTVKAKKIQVSFLKGWDRAKAVALGKRLATSQKLFSYGWLQCNEQDYMEYIIRGKVNEPLAFGYDCPLRRKLRKMTVEEIQKLDSLWNGKPAAERAVPLT